MFVVGLKQDETSLNWMTLMYRPHSNSPDDSSDSEKLDYCSVMPTNVDGCLRRL